MSSRTSNSLKNGIYAIIWQIVALVFTLISRVVFLRYLNADYLGANGLFSNIITILSFSELGMGTIMIYLLYKPIKDDNKKKICTLLNYYNKIYMIIGITVFILGIILLPFYRYFIRETNIQNLDIIYLLFILNSVLSYFWCYKKTIITAYQKQYVVTNIRYFMYCVTNILQMISLVLWGNYYIYLGIQCICTLFENLLFNYFSNRYFPYMKEKSTDKIEEEDKNELKKSIKNIVYHKFGGIVLKTTDNVVLSSFFGLALVGIYSSYTFIVNSIETIINQVIYSVSSSIGDLNANNDKEKMYYVYKKVYYINFVIYCFFSTCIYGLINLFMEIWLGDGFVLPKYIVLAITLNFFLYGLRKPLMIYREADANYGMDKYSPIFEAIINIGASILLVKFIGVSGVVLGTIISFLFTCFWTEPLSIFKKTLNRSVKDFFKQYLKYIIIFIIVFITSNLLLYEINFSSINIVNFIIKAIIYCFVTGILILLFTFKTEEFAYYIQLCKKILKRRKE